MYFVFFNEHYIPYKPQIRIAIHLVFIFKRTAILQLVI